jgi:hypothetical protein
MALAARFRHIRAPAQLGCESFCRIRHGVDEAPESLVLADIGKPLAAHGEKTQFLAAFRPEDNEEPLDVGKARWMFFLHARPIQEEDVPALQDFGLDRVVIGHSLAFYANDWFTGTMAMLIGVMVSGILDRWATILSRFPVGRSIAGRVPEQSRW